MLIIITIKTITLKSQHARNERVGGKNRKQKKYRSSTESTCSYIRACMADWLTTFFLFCSIHLTRNSRTECKKDDLSTYRCTYLVAATKLHLKYLPTPQPSRYLHRSNSVYTPRYDISKFLTSLWPWPYKCCYALIIIMIFIRLQVNAVRGLCSTSRHNYGAKS